MAGFGQDVHRILLPGLCFGEVALSGHLVPTRLDPLGIERIQPVLGRVYRPLGVGKLEFGLPVCSLGQRELLLCPADVSKRFALSGGHELGILVCDRRAVRHHNEVDGVAPSDRTPPAGC